VIGVLVVVALAALGYMVWDLRQQVDDLKSLASAQSRVIGDLESQVSSIDRFETYVTASQLDSELRSIQDDVNGLGDDVNGLGNDVDGLDALLCGSGCILVGPFADVDQTLIDLTSCVNDFIDAWANNGRAFYC